jgi:hypothetical protein
MADKVSKAKRPEALRNKKPLVVVKPDHDYILIIPVSKKHNPENKIKAPDGVRDPRQLPLAQVVAVGPGILLLSGEYAPIPYQKGDFVMTRFRDQIIILEDVNGQYMGLTPWSNIIGKVENIDTSVYDIGEDSFSAVSKVDKNLAVMQKRMDLERHRQGRGHLSPAPR